MQNQINERDYIFKLVYQQTENFMLLNCKLLLFSTVIFYNPEGLKSGEWTLPLGQIPRQNPLDKSPD